MCSVDECKRKNYLCCNLCTENFCTYHQLPEKHQCKALKTHIKILYEDHIKRLEAQKCANGKIINI